MTKPKPAPPPLPTGREAALAVPTVTVRTWERRMTGELVTPLHEFVALAEAYDLGPDGLCAWALELSLRYYGFGDGEGE